MKLARNFMRILTGKGDLARLRTPPRFRSILSATELERAFQRERCLADRSGQMFSLVVFVPLRGTRDFSSFAQILEDRMRASDCVGYLDSRRVAVVLPQTDGDGAWVFADDVLQRLGAADANFDCEVYTYPNHWFANESSGRTPSLANGSSNGHAPLDADGPGNGPVQRAEAAAQDGLAMVRQTAQGRPVHDLAPLFVQPLGRMRRLVDIATSASLLVILSPIFLAAAIAVRLTSPGEIVFSQLRAGRGGTPFRFYKFRSMYMDAEERKEALANLNEADGPIFKIKKDPRLTPVGRFLRRSSIDELPQLWNVLIGDMTLIGPRPPTLDEVPLYDRWQRNRLNATGGLTCIWQVNGRSEVGFEDWVRMDLRYLRKRSFLLDVKLLWRTIFAVLSARGAY